MTKTIFYDTIYEFLKRGGTMYTDKSDVLNKGVPIGLSRVISLPGYTICEYAINEAEVRNQIISYVNKAKNFVERKILKKSLGLINISIDLIVKFEQNIKSNVLVLDSLLLAKQIFSHLNIDYQDEMDQSIISSKCNELSYIVSERKLERKFPKLYEIYLGEKKLYDRLNEILLKFNGNVNLMKQYLSSNGSFNYDIDSYIDNSVKIYNVKKFCQIYSEIIKNFLVNYDKVKKFLDNNYLDIFTNNSFRGDELEADIAMRYINKINAINDAKVKQKYLYYLNNYFNTNKNWIDSDIVFKIDGKRIMFNELYYAYIDILVANPELRVINYERDEFDNFTASEIEEYMDLELSDAKANWKLLEKGLSEERASQAIYNGIKNISEKDKREKTQEELKRLYISKKVLFDKTSNYRVVEGLNTFDGYIAYVYQNGKVILERFFERKKDGREVIATDQAIYVMNIGEFYAISKLSKSEIIRDKLCKRYIHRGNWKDKVLKEINVETGNTPNEEFNNLVLSKKIEDIV